MNRPRVMHADDHQIFAEIMDSVVIPESVDIAQSTMRGW